MKSLIAISLLTLSAQLMAKTVDVPMHIVSAAGNVRAIGSVQLQDSAHGLVLTLKLKALAPEIGAGLRGFHVHSAPSCAAGEKDGAVVVALAAGPHLDPTGKAPHGSPYDTNAHLGDLPALWVDSKGEANYSMLAPRLKLKDVRKRSLMIHAGGDNHADHPAPLGGGGARVGCGIIP
jgi:superoxide dismutase, Cu-Zn family